jgi:hypothetical protein
MAVAFRPQDARRNRPSAGCFSVRGGGASHLCRPQDGRRYSAQLAHASEMGLRPTVLRTGKWRAPLPGR